MARRRSNTFVAFVEYSGSSHVRRLHAAAVAVGGVAAAVPDVAAAVAAVVDAVAAAAVGDSGAVCCW